MLNRENGRSVLEMLGVLVVLGIIGLSGVSAYRYGMNRYMANGLIADLHDMAVSASTKLMLPGNTHHFNPVGALKYPYTSALDKANKTFSITVSSVPGGLCSAVLAKEWDLPYEILVNNVVNGACHYADNVMKFSFYDKLYDRNSGQPSPAQ